MPPLIYAGFWRRAFALLVDIAVLIVVMVPYYALQGPSIPAAVVALLALTAFSVAYPVYFLSRWGQTLGKMAAGIRVVRLDGDPIAPRHAWLRTSVDIALSLAYCIGGLHVLTTWTGPEWSSLAWHERGDALVERSPTDALYHWVSVVWVWSELVVILFNRKRRALHDFIAGTVVIKLRTRPAIVPAEAASPAVAPPLVVHQTKSRKVRRVPLAPELAAEVRSHVGRLVAFARSSPGSFAGVVKRATGIERLHVHQMRHTFACQWLERGGGLAALQQILGHASIVTTQRYAKLTDEAVMREAQRLGNAQDGWLR